MLKQLAKLYEFDYGFVTNFDEKLNYSEEKLSKVASVCTNPKVIMSNCKTVVVIAFKHDVSCSSSNIASFALGEDYHRRLNRIGKELEPMFKNGKFLVDTHLLNERYFAQKSGIGFIGKNSMFISEKYGSYCHLALLLTSEKIIASTPKISDCNNCRLCIDACPVEAIDDQIDCRNCISERLQKRNNLNFDKLGNNVYGCDICQKVCPMNNGKYNECIVETLTPVLLSMTRNEFKQYDNRGFYWIGYRTFIRNIHIAYINKTKDYSKLKYLESSNSGYIKKVIKILKGEDI
ncbi:MAG: epoxyqueuosine reductase [Bacilli bacterium]